MDSNDEGLCREDARKRIEHEDHLINHRVSWLVGSQAFLFTAFVLLRNNPGYYEKIEAAEHLEYAKRMTYLVFCISLVGMVIALSSFIGVLAAFRAISYWKSLVPIDQREHLTSAKRLPFFGALASILPGPLVFCVWFTLLVLEWPTIWKQMNSPWEILRPFLLFGALVVSVFVSKWVVSPWPEEKT